MFYLINPMLDPFICLFGLVFDVQYQSHKLSFFYCLGLIEVISFRRGLTYHYCSPFSKSFCQIADRIDEIIRVFNLVSQAKDGYLFPFRSAEVTIGIISSQYVGSSPSNQVDEPAMI